MNNAGEAISDEKYVRALAGLQARIEYVFKDTTLLALSMRHVGRHERLADELVQVKSLETLGDGIVNRQIEKIFPDPNMQSALPKHFAVSDRQSLRHFFQSNAYLSLCALRLHLDDVIRVPRFSQTNQIVIKKIRHLANAFERLVGAIAKDDDTFETSHTRLRKLLFPEGLSTPLMKAIALCCSSVRMDQELGFKQITGDENAEIEFVDTVVNGARVRYVTFRADGHVRTYDQHGTAFVNASAFVRGFLLHFLVEFPEFLWKYAGLGSVSIVYPFAAKPHRQENKSE
jgi:dsRNA-specific ribonuclease